MRKSRMLYGCLSILLTMILCLSPLSATAATIPGDSQLADMIVEAINNNDIQAIKSMFSPYYQESIPDLYDQIQNLVSQIEIDRPIENYQFHLGGGTDGRDDNGNVYSTSGFQITIPIPKDLDDRYYSLSVHRINVWSADRKRVGVDSLSLVIGEPDHGPVELLTKIGLPVEEKLHYRESYDTHMCKWDDLHYFSKLGYTKLIVNSSDESVATIDEDGIITATGRGTARITITYRNEELNKDWTFEYDVTVTFTTWQTIIWYLFFGFLWY